MQMFPETDSQGRYMRTFFSWVFIPFTDMQISANIAAGGTKYGDGLLKRYNYRGKSSGDINNMTIFVSYFCYTEKYTDKTQ